MIDYYTSIVLLSWMALGVLSVLIWENDRLTSSDKRLLYLTYALIAVSALAEWCGVQLDGRTDVPKWALAFVKCMDYILTPMAGGALVEQMRLRNRWQNILRGILIANTAFQCVSAFTGWMIVIDENHHYTHGPLYGVYMLVYLMIIALVIIQCVLYGRLFRRQNRKSLYASMLLVIVGIAIQEALPSDNRTAYIAMTLGAALMFIHYSEFSQLAMDDHMTEQQRQIDTDPLTGMLSRSAYSRALKTLDAAGALPGDLAAFTIDINGLKRVNDTQGHEAGDELIRGAAECIETVIGNEGKCYRTGGDEFVALTSMNRESAENTLQRLKDETERWCGKTVKTLSVSAGFALAEDYDGDDLTAEALIRESDKAMYEAKAAYYQNAGRDRRKRWRV